ncbi:HU family DNA-binding protein [Pseudomonas fluorescens]|nr:HU family DNA-binding protein [Pseudomonas fluorescens]
MNKNDLVEAIASSADLPKSTAGRALEALKTIISAALQNGENITLAGFGTFEVKARAMRDGRNPRTGAIIKIAA